jgi:hypothetical protein
MAFGHHLYSHLLNLLIFRKPFSCDKKGFGISRCHTVEKQEVYHKIFSLRQCTRLPSTDEGI